MKCLVETWVEVSQRRGREEGEKRMEVGSLVYFLHDQTNWIECQVSSRGPSSLVLTTHDNIEGGSVYRREDHQTFECCVHDEDEGDEGTQTIQLLCILTSN